ncbi:DUF4870 domain-containing protein [Thermoleptolyngbya oregonensis NK1-22]|jgi:uncharacterized Tic20 family protein|uniref:DUF4870 domain-containing protein n=1 Tax=Thermoleptolyngbya oregonensis NK1-22 TaxID=2547457 RepID=A0AA97BDV0_9CYAN|nr:DUF4870 domain-containing protein [Thermoleptolyngbya sp. M55_K2018_002]WOB44756.1 DUF4870 domain-containing protein [Thermoleptolyngbya oregonensis NK1-22]HIK42601.1 DUF4870 domain-containing protein [Thermoleptolyngbya sp. M55_K2018_002]
MQSSDNSDKRKILSALCHGSIFINALVVSIGIPIAILLVSDDPVVKENAKEAINFHINMWLWWLVVGVLSIVLVGFLLFPILGLVNLILPIVAIFACLSNPETRYRYPFILRLV